MTPSKYCHFVQHALKKLDMFTTVMFTTAMFTTAMVTCDADSETASVRLVNDELRDL